jgi:superoxide dismutase, Fe-Mn family
MTMDATLLDDDTSPKAGAEGGGFKHQLPPLPYDPTALEPHIDARTMHVHHDKHHASYVEKLNTALEPFPDLQKKTALWLLLNGPKIPKEISKAVHNNAGGHVNHTMFWQSMTPGGGDGPAGPLADAIKQDFGSFEAFKTDFDQTGAAVFGSGWVWLVKGRGGRLEITTTNGHDNPLVKGDFPLLLNDVWEHAYYLKYENRRPEYLKGWWPVVNWREVEARYARSELAAERGAKAVGGTRS